MLRGVARACGASLKRVANVARTAMVSSSPSHGENRGSSPLGSANGFKCLQFQPPPARWHFSKISPTAVTVLVYLVCGLLRASALNRRE
jgi:hypothetical protein